MKQDQATMLIVGGSGYVGSTLARAFASEYNVVATYHKEFTREKNIKYISFSKLGDKDACKALVTKIEPDYVIYCAGKNDLMFCEQDVNLRLVQLMHSTGSSNFLNAADSVKARFIYLSSDYIFSGIDGNFSETDSAISAFQLGKAKLGAENFIRSRSLNYLIIRCAPLLGRGTLDHPSWFDQLRESSLLGKKIRLQSRSLHNPVHIHFLVDAIRKSIQNDVKNKTLHVAGLSKVSLFECAQIFLHRLKLDPALIEATDADSHAMPSDYSLNFSETLKMLEIQPLLLEESLEQLFNSNLTPALEAGL
jgi:dTDP-4-dehydrorhamnose reductase